MIKPVRVQLHRTKGWKMPVNTVRVTRPGKWGNPFRVGKEIDTAEEAVRCYERYIHAAMDEKDASLLRDDLHELRGKNLACWCKIGDPCHADVLLELANK